jgi:hypothetical protein
MTTIETIDTIRSALAEAIAKHTDACETHARLHGEYVAAAAAGDDAKADTLQAEVDKAHRLMSRLELRRAALEEQACSAEEIERAERAAALKASADSMLSITASRIADMEPLAASLAELVDALSADSRAWKEARYFARQAGAVPESFATQENAARVRRLVDSLARSKTYTANICSELSRVSVFM